MPNDISQLLRERLMALPPVVQNAIASGHISERFREMAQLYQLHLDQWENIQNLIMLTVLGLVDPDELEEKITSETGLEQEKAAEIVRDVALSIFKPIREEMERELGHPEAVQEEISDVERVGQAVLREAAVPPPTPATPPPAPPTKTVLRGPASGAYKPGETSAARRNVIDDPYREPAE